MPKAQMRSGGWQDEPATDAQITRLLVMLREAEVIEPERGEPLEDYEDEAVEWANDFLPDQIDKLKQLSKGQIQMLFGHLE